MVQRPVSGREKIWVRLGFVAPETATVALWPLLRFQDISTNPIQCLILNMLLKVEIPCSFDFLTVESPSLHI